MLIGTYFYLLTRSLDAKVDNTDIAIVKALIQDGRKSFRQIAREIKASTPTVEPRFGRMKGLGIIKSIQPVFDIEKIDSQMSALIFIKTNMAFLCALSLIITYRLIQF